MKFLISIIIFIFSINLHAQDLTGTWEGSGNMGTEYVRIILVKSGDSYVGYTYDVGHGHCKTNFLGSFNTANQRLKGKSMGFIEKSGMHTQSAYNLKYTASGNHHYLNGNWWPKSAAVKILSLGIPGAVNLRRTSLNTDTTVFMLKYLNKLPVDSLDGTDYIPVIQVGKQDSIKASIVAVKQSRLADTIQTVTVPAETIKIKLYDNGVEDGDSVSVLYNEMPVVMNKVVSVKAIELELQLNKEALHHTITLVAHNLGAIPPNTSTVVIEAGSQIYRIFASADYTRNAVIIIKRE